MLAMCVEGTRRQSSLHCTQSIEKSSTSILCEPRKKRTGSASRGGCLQSQHLGRGGRESRSSRLCLATQQKASLGYMRTCLNKENKTPHIVSNYFSKIIKKFIKNHSRTFLPPPLTHYHLRQARGWPWGPHLMRKQPLSGLHSRADPVVRNKG